MSIDKGKKSYYFLGAVFLAVFLFSGCDDNKTSIPTNAITEQQTEAQKSEEIIEETKNENEKIASELFKVASVVDGDTIKLENGQVVRYIGIDSPETVHPSKPIQCFGKEASQKNKELVEGKEVRLEKDVSETDKYGRILRYVYVGDTFVNDYLVRNGFASSYSYPPDVKYQDQFKKAEEDARNGKKGLWGDICTKTETSTTTALPPTTTNSSAQNVSGSYSCNCSKTCAQMGCAEAQYQLTTCGCSKRDADKDGVACDSQCQ